ASHQCRVGPPACDGVANVRSRPGAAACDHRYVDRLRDGGREREIVPVPRAVAIDAREQDLASTPAHTLSGPDDSVERCRHTPAARVDTPVVTVPLGVNAGDYALRAESFRTLGQNLG